MKKLLSLFLVLTMVLSLFGSLGVSAMASDEMEEAAQEETTDAAAPSEDGDEADAPADEPEVSDEADVSDETVDEADEEITEPVEGEEISVEPSAAEPPEGGGTWKEANGFVAGQNYVIGIKGSGTKVTAMKLDGSAVKAAEFDFANPNPDAAFIWAAESGQDGVSLASGGLYLMYGDVVKTRDNAARNWAFSGGALSYKHPQQGTYIVGAVSGDSFTCGTSVAAASIAIFTDGSDLGSGSSSGGGAGDSGAGGGGSDLTYAPANELVAGMNVAFVVKGYTFGFGPGGSLKVSEATITDGKLKVTLDNYLEVKDNGTGGLALAAKDPPGSDTYAYLTVADGALSQTKEEVPAGAWAFADGKLSYTEDGTTYYISGASASGITLSTNFTEAATVAVYSGDEAPSGGGPGGGGETDASAPIIVSYPKAVPFVKEGSGYAAPSYSISAKIPEGVGSRSIYFQWFVGDVAVSEKTKVSVEGLADGIATDTVTIKALQGMPVGVYQVTCQVTCNTDGGTVPHTTTAMVTFAVCKGILENSFLTFSDVHETFKDVGMAIYDTLIENEGYLPALIICTGDWANGHLTGGDRDSDNYKTTMNDYIALLQAQFAGIDAIFISGNHDNGQAAADATAAAGLGAEKDYADLGMGIAYDSRNITKENSSSKDKNSNLVVFGINYEALMTDNGGYSYANVLPKLEATLQKLVDDGFKGKFVISAHAGLHVLGVQEGSNGDSWGGGKEYQIDGSYDMVTLLNKFADKLDIMFLFGHDHSKGEGELFLEPGATIDSTISYEGQQHDTQKIKFAYGHAGYLGNGAAGVQQGHYTLVTWEDDVPGFKHVLEAVVQKTAPQVTSSVGSGNGNTTTGKGSPKTGDDSNIVLWASLFFVFAGATVVVATRRKEHN